MLGPFYLYGLCVAGSGALALLILALSRKKYGVGSRAVSWFALLCVPLAVLFARIGYFLSSINWFREKGLTTFFQFIRGGYILYGAMAGVLITGWLAAKISGEKPGRLLDAAAAPGALAICLCRMAECLVPLGYGFDVEEWFNPYVYASSIPWNDPSPLFHFPIALYLDGAWRFFIAFFEALTALMIFLIALRAKKRQSGGRAVLAILIYAAFQIIWESMREDAVLRWGFVKVNMLLSALVIAAILLICCLRAPAGYKKPLRVILTWLGELILFGVIIAMEFALEQKIAFLAWMRMDLCYLTMLLCCLGIVLALLPWWKKAYPKE